MAYINKAIQQDLGATGSQSKSLADWYLWKGTVFTHLNQLDSAHDFLYRTLQIRRKIFGEKNSNTFGANYALGEYFNTIGSFDSAVWYHHQSLISLIKNFNDPHLFANPKPDPDELNSDLILGLVKKASILEKISENNTSEIDLLDLALNTYMLADSVFAGYRKNILYDDPLLQQMEGQSIPYPEMLNITLKLSKLKKSTGYLEKAFHVMENSRAIVLENALNRAKAADSVGGSDPLIQKENGLIRLRAELLQKINDVNKPFPQSIRDSLNEKLLLTYNLDVDLQNELKKVNPNYFSIRYMLTFLPLVT